LIGKAIGQDGAVRGCPADVMNKNLVAAGMPDWFAKDLVALHGFFRTGGGAEVTPTVQEITRKPARTLADFVRDFASAFKA